MLDSFMDVVYAKEAHEETERQAVELLKHLPAGDLMKLASGEKVAWLEPSPSGGSGSFLDKFQGSPLFEEALALENEELQMEMTDIEQRKEDRVRQQAQSGTWEARDQIRVKKRLLELRLAQEGAGMGDQAGGGAPMPLNAAPMPDAQGAGALGAGAGPMDVKTAGLGGALSGFGKAVRAGFTNASTAGVPKAMGSMLQQSKKPMDIAGAVRRGAASANLGGLGKTGAPRIKRAMAAGEVVKMTSLAKKLPGALPMPTKALGALGGVNKQLGNFSSLTRKVGSIDPAMFKRVDGWGRELAQIDFTKAAHASELEGAAVQAGRTLAGMRKEALGLGGIASAATGFMKNPKNLGTMIGAGVGAGGGLLHGLRKDEQGQRHLLGGIAEGLGGAALGAGAGHATQNIGSAMKGGKSFGDAAKGYGRGIWHGNNKGEQLGLPGIAKGTKAPTGIPNRPIEVHAPAAAPPPAAAQGQLNLGATTSPAAGHVDPTGRTGGGYVQPAAAPVSAGAVSPTAAGHVVPAPNQAASGQLNLPTASGGSSNSPITLGASPAQQGLNFGGAPGIKNQAPVKAQGLWGGIGQALAGPFKTSAAFSSAADEAGRLFAHVNW